MTVLTDVLANPNIARIFLAETTAGYVPLLWAADTGTTYYAPITHPVVDVREDGASLTEQATVALCRSNTGSWFYDVANMRIYVNATAGADPYTKTLQVMYQFYFTNQPKIHNAIYYEPRLKSMPNLSLRVEQKFSGVTQIGGGSISFNNEDGFFDDLTDFQWDAGQTTLKIGADYQGAMAYSDYEELGTWLNKDWKTNDDTFVLVLLESKIRIKKKIPTNTYETTTYPNIRVDDIGRGIQIAYGVIKDAEPVYINQATLTFKVAGHAIVSFDDVRVKDETTGAWATVAFASTDLANAEFTLGSSDWEVGNEVVVDFSGKAKSGVIVMDNASDIVKDMLTTYVGEHTANINTTSFTDAYNVSHLGTYPQTGKNVTSLPIGLYIDNPTPAETLIKEINQAVFAYLFADSSGQYFYKAFVPVPGEGLPEFTTIDIDNFSESTKNTVISKIDVKYNKRLFSVWAQTYTYEDTSKQYLHNEPSAELVTKDVLISTKAGARVYAQRFLEYEGRPQKLYSFTVPSRIAVTLLPADFVRLVYPRHGVDGTYEIMKISHNLQNDKTSITVGDMHSIGERAGYVVGGSDVLPTRFANLTGYGSGSLTWNSSWDDIIKTWARQNVAYVTDVNGFADPTDVDSRYNSAAV